MNRRGQKGLIDLWINEKKKKEKHGQIIIWNFLFDKWD